MTMAHRAGAGFGTAGTGTSGSARAAGWIPVPEPAPEPRLPPDARKRSGNTVWDVLLGLDLALIAVSGLFGILAYLWFTLSGTPVVREVEDGQGMLWATNVWNLVTYGVVPFVWLLGTRVDGWSGTVRYLGLTRPFPAVLHGLGYAALLAGLAFLMFLSLDLVGLGPESTGAEMRFVGITWGLALVTALVAGFAEEVFFRGMLQRWLGVWGQAGVFGLMHLPAGWMAFLVTGLIGLLFGFLVKRGRSLWLVISAHASYNMILFGTMLLTGG